ncbi:MAG: hypothetical protein QOF71_3625 [Candidatus Eremiobacteraeota bacterium]|nr:hypothetical protein [Candidatus Eremiobacteraeota bacterium]
MSDVLAVAAAYGVRVEMADLGDWAAVTLVAEYDPEGPVIRVNKRVLGRTKSSDAIDRAIAHEIYHHREAIGEVARIADRSARERAADAFADELVRSR